MRKPDLTRVLTGVVVLTIVGVAAYAFIGQKADYDTLLGLYTSQQRQLLSHGITPTGPPVTTGRGLTGIPGQPPFSWTYLSGAGTKRICTRDIPFDAAKPTYNCAVYTPAPSPSPTR